MSKTLCVKNIEFAFGYAYFIMPKSATKAKCPIVPIALIDSYKSFDTKSIEKIKVQVHILKPMLYEEYKDMKTVEIAAEVKRRIEAVIAEYENK